MEMECTTEDISSKNKPKCLALGIGGGALAALMLVGIVAAVGGGGAWCYLQGPCAPAKSSEQSGTAAPSEVIGKDMSAEFSSGESGTSSTSSRLRRRLADATGKIALSSFKFLGVMAALKGLMITIHSALPSRRTR
jgi:hypothetical protein